ncbi:hypothetical protein OR1_01733 [Geobacter sp. OR-1]|uniref:DUF4384 domain-containing protein n=1 Tax=Geobacter sp. OR-1 TaxID=1266765 RepID=UPI0005421A9E|nr:DUF4384 domain-containing protein [Geobacter sp. OR-1]GAM09454.1 hypothetical protein OR1_01733 [Geobacter sp. OR-1]
MKWYVILTILLSPVHARAIENVTVKQIVEKCVQKADTPCVVGVDKRTITVNNIKYNIYKKTIKELEQFFADNNTKFEEKAIERFEVIRSGFSHLEVEIGGVKEDTAIIRESVQYLKESLEPYFLGKNLGDIVKSKRVVATGTGCAGHNLSLEQAVQFARRDAVTIAKKEAVSRVSAFFTADNTGRGKISGKNVEQAISATVEVVGDIVYSEPLSDASGICLTASFSALVSVDANVLKDMSAGPSFNADPNAFLNVRVWTDKHEYYHGEKLKIYVMANKDFYLDLLYVDAGMRKIKVIPNQYRTDTRFKGGQVHEIPVDEKEFTIEVDCEEGKCGQETLVATASTHKILYDPDTSGAPIAGTNISEYKGDVRKRSIKILAGSSSNVKDIQSLASSYQETAQSTLVLYTRK